MLRSVATIVDQAKAIFGKGTCFLSRMQECWSLLVPLLGCGALAFVSGCHHVAPGRQAIDDVRVLQNTKLDDSEITDKIATAASPRFLGIWDGVAFDYVYLDRFVLQQDVARIERIYRAQGYYDVKVRAARVIPTGEQGHVRVEIVVDEGPPTIVNTITPDGMNTVPFEHQAVVLDAIEAGLKIGEKFDESRYESTKDRIRVELMNRGFAWAKVDGHVVVNLL
ncbi:MAG: hypothetical protein CSA75_03685, partial [Sorangium cellulosum]